MSHFNRTSQFEKEFKKLLRRFPSLEQDLERFEKVLLTSPVGFGNNFTIIVTQPTVTIVKARLACSSLRDRSLRVIYAFHKNEITFVYLELYFKGDKVNEDRGRIREYIESIPSE